MDQRSQQFDHYWPTGLGKSLLAWTFAQKACREGFNALYLRMTKLFEDMRLAKGDGRYLKLLTHIGKADCLYLVTMA
jgi:DNA replication protein DnaC